MKLTLFSLVILLIFLIFAAIADAKSDKLKKIKAGNTIEVTENGANEATLSVDGEKIKLKRRKLDHVPAKDQPRLAGATNIEPLDCVFTASDKDGEIIYQSTKKCKGGEDKKDTILSQNGEKFDIDNEQDLRKGKKKGTLKASKKEPIPELVDIPSGDDDFSKNHGKKNPKFLRSKRQIPPGNKIIDIAVVYDHEVYANAAAAASPGQSAMMKIMLFHTAVFEEANLIMFNLEQTTYRFRYACFFTSVFDTPNVIAGTQNGDDMAVYIKDLSTFFLPYNFGQDYWAFFTGFNLQYDGDSNVVGIAYTGTMCIAFSNLPAIMGFGSEVHFAQTNKWHSVIVAHETGHTLGIRHDLQHYPACGFGDVMYPSVTLTDTWSTCSVAAYMEHLQLLVDNNIYCLN